MSDPERTPGSTRRDRDVIRRTAELLASDVPLRDVFAQLCRLLESAIDARRVFIALREEQTLRIVYLLDEGVGGDVERTDLVAGAASDTVVATARPVLEGASAYVPLKFGADVLGVLSAQRSIDQPLDEEDVELLQTCSLYLALRVHDARQAGLNRALQSLVASDGLTGVPNRRAFDEHLGAQWERCAATAAPLAIVFADVDHFKAFDDSYGHLAGDACLRQVAQALAACAMRPGDLLARYGGEEFVAILPATTVREALLVAERMRAAVAAIAIEHDASSLGHVSISVGVATATATAESDPIHVVKDADQAVYRAKAGGRNRVAGPDYLSTGTPVERRQRTRHNLPLQLTRFLGRERALAEVRSLLGNERLVTLAGPGGIGKTRLAAEAARAMLDAFAGGVCFIDLAPIDDAGLIPGAIAAALELEGTDASPSIEMIASALRSKPSLLIVDNCEHLIDASARCVAALLAAAPPLRVLATSREPLGIGGERVYRVESLAVPPSETPLTAEGAREHESVRFFAARAADAANFVLADDNVADVVRVCRRLDGIPLAIELAAARLRALTVAELAEQLDDSFRILAGPDRASLPRQQTMQTLIDWSYSLLTPQERSVFAALAVFSGSWTLAAASAVAAHGPLARDDVVACLTQLVDKSLVLMDRGAAANRYRFLESTREYARACLGASGEAEPVRERFVRYYLQLAEHIAAAQSELPTRRWLPPLLPEWDNFRSVLTLCLHERRDAVTGAMIVVALVPYWEAMSRPGEALMWLDLALTAVALPPALRARIELAIAFFLRTTNQNPVRTAELARHALDVAVSNDDERMRCTALINVGGAELMQNGTAEAVPFLEEALSLARATGDRLAESDALNNLGICADYDGDPVRSRLLYEESLGIARAIGHDRKIARALHNLCAVMQDAGDLDAAVRYEREAIATIEPWGRPRQFMIDLADLELIRGNLTTAGRICQDILEGLVFERSMWQVRECLFVFAQIHARAGHDARAAALVGFMETLDADLAPRQPTFESMYEEFRAGLRARLGDDDFARWSREGSLLALDAAVAQALQPL